MSEDEISDTVRTVFLAGSRKLEQFKLPEAVLYLLS